MPIKVSKVKQSSSIQPAHPAPAETEAVPSLAWPMELWLQFQADLFRASEPVLIGWIDRRCEGTGALMHSVERLTACQDFGEAVAIHSEWLTGVMGRLDRDVQALAEHALAVSQCASGATQQAAQATTGVAMHGAKWVVRKAEPVATSPANAPDALVTPVTEALWQTR
jgi:hypothetical protein